ncbi:MAG TPA: hypothetical protein VD788_04600 [Candidatus Polarisedimenticolaceae bacterium]|nr:hypothetical protein [Candidatus Polarisedimenticolaceae bacterium]
MKKWIERAGNLSGVVGLAVCVVAGLSRLTGAFYTAGFQTMVLFNVGVGLMVAGCLAKLHALSER